MGRKKIYQTEEEKRLARNEYRMKYYWNNCEKEKKKALDRYYEKKKSEKNKYIS
jgi:hypothetical protein